MSTSAGPPSSSMKAVLLAGVLASAPLLASAATGNYAYFTDRDSGGGALYGGAPVWVRNAATCQAACTADPNCYGWTFSVPSVSGWDGPCYLKGQVMCDASSLNKIQTPGKFVSGVIGDQCTVVCSGKTVVVPSGNCAIVTPTPTSTKAAGRYKRDMAEREARALGKALCPRGQTACPIGQSHQGYECVDVSEELESCGECGNDCTALPGTKDVACSQGKCIVSSCVPGFQLSLDGTCKKTSKAAHRRGKGIAHAVHAGRSAL